MSKTQHTQHLNSHTLAIEQITESILDPLFSTSAMATESTESVIHQYQPVSTLTDICSKMITNGHNASIESIHIAHSTVTAISKKLDLNNTTRLPSMECFHNKYESRIAHNIAVESIIDMIVSVWRAIKNAIIKMWDAIKSFFRNLFDASKQLERKIESLKKELDEVTTCNDRPTFTNDEITKAFTINNRFVNSNVNSILDSQCEVTNDLNRLSGKLKEITDGSFDAIKAITDNLKNYKESPDTTANTTPPHTPDVDMQSHTENDVIKSNILIKSKVDVMMGELRNGLVTLLNLSVTSNDSDGLIGTSKKAFLYGKRLELSATKDDDYVQLFMEITTPENSVKHNIAVLTISEMRSVLVGCTKLLKMEAIVASTISNIDKATNCLIRMIEKIEDTLVTINKDPRLKENLVTSSDSLKGFKLYVNSILGVINTVYTNVPIMNIKAVKLAVELVEMSASKYSRK